eukprot:Platyproteum_vivax@DN10686_c0_g1_i1.p1
MPYTREAQRIECGISEDGAWNNNDVLAVLHRGKISLMHESGKFTDCGKPVCAHSKLLWNPPGDRLFSYGAKDHLKCWWIERTDAPYLLYIKDCDEIAQCDWLLGGRLVVTYRESHATAEEQPYSVCVMYGERIINVPQKGVLCVECIPGSSLMCVVTSLSISVWKMELDNITFVCDFDYHTAGNKFWFDSPHLTMQEDHNLPIIYIPDNGSPPYLLRNLIWLTSEEAVCACVFGPEENYVAVGLFPSCVRIFEITSGECTGMWELSNRWDNWITDMEWTAERKVLLVTTTLNVYVVHFEHLESTD